MEKVFVISGMTTTMYDDGTDFNVASVHATEDGAKKGLRAEIDNRCACIKEDYMEQFNDEDYAEDFDGYDTFEEFWDDWVKEHTCTSDYWRYDTDELSIVVFVKAVEVCE